MYVHSTAGYASMLTDIFLRASALGIVFCVSAWSYSRVKEYPGMSFKKVMLPVEASLITWERKKRGLSPLPPSCALFVWRAPAWLNKAP